MYLLRNRNPVWEWVKYHPLRLGLILFGLALVAFSAQAQGYAFASVTTSPTEVWLQPQTEISIPLHINIQSNELVPVSYSIQTVQGIHVDGDLQSIPGMGNFTRHVRIRADATALPGTYSITLTTHMQIDGKTFHYPTTIRVHISPAQRVDYFTSANSTIEPHIDQIRVSPTTTTLQRSQVAYVDVSFRNVGNTTDYVIEIPENPLYVFASVQNPTHAFVNDNETVSSQIEIRAFDYSPFETIPITVYARNRVTQEKFFLGRINVSVEKVSNIEITTPFDDYELEQGEFQLTDLTIQNTELSDIDVLVRTSSEYAEVTPTQVHIPKNSSITIPLKLIARPQIGTQTETIYVFNRDMEKSISLHVKTVEPLVLKGEIETRVQNIQIENNMGKEWQNVSLRLRNIPLGWKVSILPTSITLLPGETASATLTLQVPKNAIGKFQLLVVERGKTIQTISIESKPELGAIPKITGFLISVGSPLLGLIILVVAALLIFSGSFRNRMKGYLPKPKPPVPAPKLPSIPTKVVETTQTVQQTETTVSEKSNAVETQNNSESKTKTS